jgi:hypothetical protein
MPERDQFRQIRLSLFKRHGCHFSTTFPSTPLINHAAYASISQRLPPSRPSSASLLAENPSAPLICRLPAFLGITRFVSHPLGDEFIELLFGDLRGNELDEHTPSIFGSIDEKVNGNLHRNQLV